MKKLTTFLFGAAAMLLAFTTVSCNPKSEESGELKGTYSFESVYNVIMDSDVTGKINAREDGTLDMITGMLDEQDFFEGLTDGSFTFTGSTCMINTPEGSFQADSYSLSGGRLSITAEGQTISFGYKTSPHTIFVIDMTTLRAMDVDVDQDMGIRTLEIWFTMQVK